MKRILSVLILIDMLILPLLFPLGASAETTTLTTAVPKQVTVTVDVTGKGTVAINGQATTDNAKFSVARLEDVNVLFVADSDYLLKVVCLNGVDVTDHLNNGLMTIESIQFDTDLVVTFTQKNPIQSEGIPVTGDTSHLNAILLCWLGSLIILVVLLHCNRKCKQ